MPDAQNVFDTKIYLDIHMLIMVHKHFLVRGIFRNIKVIDILQLILILNT